MAQPFWGLFIGSVKQEKSHHGHKLSQIKQYGLGYNFFLKKIKQDLVLHSGNQIIYFPHLKTVSINSSLSDSVQKGVMSMV